MNEDMILPEGFEEATTPTETPEQVETQAETTEINPEAQPQATETTETPQPFLKVKYNKEELDLDEERARELAQKGLNYDKLQERLQALESDPRLSFVENLAKQYGMTPDEYIQAVQAQQEQERINELVQQGISEELAQEMLENRKFRQQFEAERQAKAEEEKKNAEYNDFFDYFKQANGRDFNSQTDEIPQSVWEMNANGIPLKYAYMQHLNQQLQQQLQTLKQNEENAKKAPVGSVTANGSVSNISEEDDPFLQGFNSV